MADVSQAQTGMDSFHPC